MRGDRLLPGSGLPCSYFLVRRRYPEPFPKVLTQSQARARGLTSPAWLRKGAGAS